MKSLFFCVFFICGQTKAISEEQYVTTLKTIFEVDRPYEEFSVEKFYEYYTKPNMLMANGDQVYYYDTNMNYEDIVKLQKELKEKGFSKVLDILKRTFESDYEKIKKETKLSFEIETELGVLFTNVLRKKLFLNFFKTLNEIIDKSPNENEMLALAKKSNINSFIKRREKILTCKKIIFELDNSSEDFSEENFQKRYPKQFISIHHYSYNYIYNDESNNINALKLAEKEKQLYKKNINIANRYNRTMLQDLQKLQNESETFFKIDTKLAELYKKILTKKLYLNQMDTLNRLLSDSTNEYELDYLASRSNIDMYVCKNLHDISKRFNYYSVSIYQ